MKANPRYAEITKTLYNEGAFAVIENINQIESLLGAGAVKR
jgi:hypothetical protein